MDFMLKFYFTSDIVLLYGIVIYTINDKSIVISVILINAPLVYRNTDSHAIQARL